MSIAIEQHIAAKAPPALPDNLHSPAGSPHAFSYLQKESTYPRGQVLPKEQDFCSTSRNLHSRGEYARTNYSPSGSSLPALPTQAHEPTAAGIIPPNTTPPPTNMDAANDQPSGAGQPPAKRRRPTVPTKNSSNSKAQKESKVRKTAKTAKTSKAPAHQNPKTSTPRRVRTTQASSGFSRESNAIMDERERIPNHSEIPLAYNQNLYSSLNAEFQNEIESDNLGENGPSLLNHIYTTNMGQKGYIYSTNDQDLISQDKQRVQNEYNARQNAAYMASIQASLSSTAPSGPQMPVALPQDRDISQSQTSRNTSPSVVFLGEKNVPTRQDFRKRQPGADGQTKYNRSLSFTPQIDSNLSQSQGVFNTNTMFQYPPSSNRNNGNYNPPYMVPAVTNPLNLNSTIMTMSNIGFNTPQNMASIRNRTLARNKRAQLKDPQSNSMDLMNGYINQAMAPPIAGYIGMHNGPQAPQTTQKAQPQGQPSQSQLQGQPSGFLAPNSDEQLKDAYMRVVQQAYDSGNLGNLAQMMGAVQGQPINTSFNNTGNGQQPRSSSQTQSTWNLDDMETTVMNNMRNASRSSSISRPMYMNGERNITPGAGSVQFLPPPPFTGMGIAGQMMSGSLQPEPTHRFGSVATAFQPASSLKMQAFPSSNIIGSNGKLNSTPPDLTPKKPSTAVNMSTMPTSELDNDLFGDADALQDLGLDLDAFRSESVSVPNFDDIPLPTTKFYTTINPEDSPGTQSFKRLMADLDNESELENSQNPPPHTVTSNLQTPCGQDYTDFQWYPSSNFNGAQVQGASSSASQALVLPASTPLDAEFLNILNDQELLFDSNFNFRQAPSNFNPQAALSNMIHTRIETAPPAPPQPTGFVLPNQPDPFLDEMRSAGVPINDQPQNIPFPPELEPGEDLMEDN